MKGKMTITTIDGRRQEISLGGVIFITMFADNQEYRIKILNEADGLQVAVDAQLVIYPHASNLVSLKGEAHGA